MVSSSDSETPAACRIWTRAANSISCDNDCYTEHAFRSVMKPIMLTEICCSHNLVVVVLKCTQYNVVDKRILTTKQYKQNIFICQQIVGNE